MPISSKESVNKLHNEVRNCKKCLDLLKTRKQPVPADFILEFLFTQLFLYCILLRQYKKCTVKWFQRLIFNPYANKR